MSAKRLRDGLSRPAAVFAALLVLAGASLWLDTYNPKKGIEERFNRKYCCPPGGKKLSPCKEGQNPFFLTDSAKGFEPAALHRMLLDYEKEDVSAHRLFIIYDFFYPFAYAIPWVVFILWLQRKFSYGPVRGWRRWLFLAPLAAAAFDLVENASMWYIVGAVESWLDPNFPAGERVLDATLVSVTIAGNVLKWAFVFISVALIGAGLAGFALKWVFGARFEHEGSAPS